MIVQSTVQSVTYTPSHLAHPRKGWLGWLTDKLLGMRYIETTGPQGWSVVTGPGKILYSQDAVTWSSCTRITTP